MGGNNNLKQPASDPWLRRQLSRAGGAGKGDAPRPVNRQTYQENYERIFGKKPMPPGNYKKEDL